MLHFGSNGIAVSANVSGFAKFARKVTHGVENLYCTAAHSSRTGRLIFGYAVPGGFGSSNDMMTEAGKREDPLGQLMSRSQSGDAAAYSTLLQEIASVLRRVIR